jgi:chorismate mutase
LEYLGDPRSFGQPGAVKYANGQPIDDRAREREILQDVAGALEAGPYTQAGIQFFRDPIEANKAIHAI